jgi:hypothetical protein
LSVFARNVENQKKVFDKFNFGLSVLNEFWLRQRSTKVEGKERKIKREIGRGKESEKVRKKRKSKRKVRERGKEEKREERVLKKGKKERERYI